LKRPTRNEASVTPRRLGVRAYLFLVVAASAALPVAISGAFFARRWVEADAATADRVTLAMAGSFSKQLGQELLGHVRSIEVLAAQIQMSGIADSERLHAVLRVHAMSHPENNGALVLHPDGISLAATSVSGQRGRSGLSYSDRDYFQRVKTTLRTTVSPRVNIGRITRVLNIHTAAPAFDRDGKLIAIVVSSVDVAPIAVEAHALASGLGDEGRLVVVDAEGHLIADSEVGGAAAAAGPAGQGTADGGGGRSAAAGFVSGLRDVSAHPIFGPPSGDRELRRGADERGRPVRAGVVPVDFAGLGWRIVALRTVSSIQHQGDVVHLETVLFTAAALLGAVGLAALVAAWLARPVRALAQHAERVGQGDFGSLPGPVRGGPREIATLTNAVRTMIQSLGAHAESLEGVVAQRTAELTLANSRLGEALAALQEKERVIVDDLAQAKLFQQKILPALPASADLEWSARYLPLAEVGGDIFDIHEIAPGHFRVFLADAVGHGIQASMRTIVLKAEYDRLKAAHRSPARVLHELNRRLVALLPRAEALCAAACFDVRSTPPGAEIVYANAAQNPILRLAHGRFGEIPGEGPLLGLVESTWEDPLPIRIDPGEILIASTDGLVEQQNDAGQVFEDRLLGMRVPGALTAEQALADLLEAMHSFRGQAPLSDDITMIAVKILPDAA
jgi:serine phosphatase RsbU (regulator of sigma subunit)